MGDVVELKSDNVSPEQWRKYYEALVPRVKQLEDQVLSLSQQNSALRAENTMLAIRAEGQNRIIQEAVNGANATSQTYLEENKSLRAELAVLKAGR